MVQITIGDVTFDLQGFVKLAIDNYKPLKDLLSIPEERKAACPMLFGYSSYKITSIPRRNPVDITWK